MNEKGAPGPFSVLVQGDWGCRDDLPKSLRNKLLCYFQSRKKSGGGECELQILSGQVWVCFAQEEVRQRVLFQKTHELDLAEKGKLKLVVTLDNATGATDEDVSKGKTLSEQASKGEDNPGEMAVQEDVQKEDFTANSSIGENACQEENILANEKVSSLVVLENVNKSTSHEFLTLLVENISGLSGEKDFQMELVIEKNAAIVTFKQNLDAAKFVSSCVQNIRFKEHNFSARPLELTCMIRVENIPVEVCKDFIILYFESPKHGGGQVSDIQLFPEENAAVISFCDHQAVQTVLKKQHSFKHQPIGVYPYYSSLDIILYGKDRPQIKMPEPVKFSLDPYIWQFLQTRNKLVQEINQEMTSTYCELMWPQMACKETEIMIRPSAALSNERPSTIKTWKEKVSKEIACIMSKFKKTQCKVTPVAWETIKNIWIKDDVLAIPDASKEIVILAGFVFTVDSVEKLVNEYVGSVTKDVQRAKTAAEEMLPVAPGHYDILHCILQEENVSQNIPGIKLSYNSSAEMLQLSGMDTEVYKIKSYLLEKLLNMKEEQIDIHPGIFQFLKHADHKKVSMRLFGANKIQASYQLARDSVTLIGHSPEGFLKAKEQMKKELDCKDITLEDQAVINKKEWKELVIQVERKHNYPEKHVIIEFSGENSKVTVAGYTKPVEDVYQLLFDFVEQNIPMLKVIPAKSVAVVQFMEKEKCQVWDDLKSKGTKIDFGPQAKCKNIILSGPKAKVLKAALVVEQMLSSVHSVNVKIDKPGTKMFFRSREHTYVNEVKQYFNCLIRLQKDGEGTERAAHTYSKIQLKDGIVVAVHKGDLTCYPVDVVVNASNESLKHIGGLAEALLKAAGPALQRDCDELVRKHGQLKPGSAVITGAGNLQCKQVIHAVGPRWDSSEKDKCVLLLKKAVRESLRLAETYKHRSIAIPAISSGVFGFPLKKCAHSIVTAIKENLEGWARIGSLKQVFLVDFSDNTVQALSDALNEVFREGPPQSLPSHMDNCHKEVEENVQMVTFSEGLKLSHKEVEENVQMVTSSEGLKLILEEKGVEDVTTNIVVSSIGTDLRLGQGPLSKALIKKAGLMLQDEFDKAVQAEAAAQAGCVILTGGYNLACRFVLHAVVPQWDARKGNSVKILRDIVRACLEKTEELSLSSISFPAIGTGGFRFPKSEVAKLMVDEVLQFSNRKKLTTLQEVHFLLHPNDKENIQAFSEVFEKIGGIPKDVPLRDKQNAGFFGPISTPSLGMHEMQIGSIKFQVATGDITKENTDVIVSVTNSTFNAQSGVSKAILEGAGPQVDMECAVLAMQPHHGFITTKGGNLICKHIIHLVSSSDIKAQVSSVLQECERRKYASIAFPAIGTGQAGKSPDDAADAMISAVAEFAGKISVQHVKMIKIVIFQTHMQNAFYVCMQKREGSPLPTSESVFSKIKSYITGKKQPTGKKHLLVLEKKVEVAVFEICGENKGSVERAEAWLKDLILKEQEEKCISDRAIKMFGDAEIEKLKDLQERLPISICLEMKQSPPFIMIAGIPRAILTAYEEITLLIEKIKEQSMAELAKNTVEWQYSTNGDTFVAFDSVTNLHLEDAKITDGTHVEVQIQGKSYKADVNEMYATDGQGSRISIKRLVKDEDLPEQWEDMKGQRVKAVRLQPTSQEYQDVESKFRKTCSNVTIEKIERIQNPSFWRSYQIKKQELERKNGHGNNERLLFHGTPSTNLIQINKTGFNRSYAGKNAAAIGQGAYFAVNASYSANTTYCVPDSKGRKYMYLARVLTGDFCMGKSGLIIPPPKNNGEFDLYDSVTNNMAQPAMFVTFHDAQAYPEYLITFV